MCLVVWSLYGVVSRHIILWLMVIMYANGYGFGLDYYCIAGIKVDLL